MADLTQQSAGVPGQVSFNVSGNPSSPLTLPAPVSQNVSMFGQAAAANPYAGAFSGQPSTSGSPYAGAFTGQQSAGFQPTWSAPATYTPSAAQSAPASTSTAAPAAAALGPAPYGYYQPSPDIPAVAIQPNNTSPDSLAAFLSAGQGNQSADNPWSNTYNADIASTYAEPSGGGNWKGGPIDKVFGVNPPTPDDGQINAQVGEYVLRKDAVSKYGKAVLAALNAGKIDPAKLRRLVPKK